MSKSGNAAALVRDFEEVGLRNLSRAEFAYRQLLEAIRKQTLRPGDRIREDELSKMLGISRTPLRQALHQLQTRGLLEHAPSGGLVVPELSRQQVIDLYAMREILEGAAARLAALHAGPADIASMRGILKAFEAAAPDPRELARVSRLFHASLYEAAHNSYLSQTLVNFNDTLALLKGTAFMVKDRWKIELADDRQIVDAIERRDADTAEEVTRRNIREALEARLQVLFQP